MGEQGLDQGGKVCRRRKELLGPLGGFRIARDDVCHSRSGLENPGKQEIVKPNSRHFFLFNTVTGETPPSRDDLDKATVVPVFGI